MNIELIPDFRKRLDSLLARFKGKDRITSAETREMFDLHNEWFKTPKERGYACDACRVRVYQQLQNIVKHMDSIKNIEDEKKALVDLRPKPNKEEKEILEFYRRISNGKLVATNADRIWLQQIHNRTFTDNIEASRNCAACRVRMYNRLKVKCFKIKEKYLI